MLLVSPVLFIGPFSAQLNTQNLSPPHLDHMGLPFVELLCPATHVLSSSQTAVRPNEIPAANLRPFCIRFWQVLGCAKPAGCVPQPSILIILGGFWKAASAGESLGFPTSASSGWGHSQRGAGKTCSVLPSSEPAPKTSPPQHELLEGLFLGYSPLAPLQKQKQL